MAKICVTKMRENPNSDGHTHHRARLAEGDLAIGVKSEGGIVFAVAGTDEQGKVCRYALHLTPEEAKDVWEKQRG